MKVYDPDLISDDPTIQRIDNAVRAVGDEVMRAMDRFAPFNSPHEGWAVIKEELDELWEHVRANEGRDLAAYVEAKQVAAMAVRYMIDCRASNQERKP